jgi:protein SCO1
MTAALLALAGAGSIRAEDPWGLPKELDGLEITPRPDAQTPLDAVFRDEQGAVVRLGDFFDGQRPVILQLAYYRCPMLCGLVSEGLVAGLPKLEWSPGQQFDIVTVSIDAREAPELAAQKKASTLAGLNRLGAEHGWHFLTGSDASIHALADAVGFKFRFLPERNDFAHAAGIFVLTPDGRVSQTITGLVYDPRTLKLSLVEASVGKVGTLLDQVLLYCFHYDPKSGTYTPVIMNIMRLGFAVTVLVLGTFVGTLFWRERRARRVAGLTPEPKPPTPASTLGTP